MEPTQVVLKPIDEVRRSITLMEPQFQAALPKQIPVERFMRVAMTAISENADLLLCDRASLYAACMKCAQDGLLPDKREAALVKFKDRVVYMPMIAGILKKVRNSGELVALAAHCVYENDKLDFGTDSARGGDYLSHKPVVFGEKGKMLGVYAIATTKDGGFFVEILDMPQIEKIRSVSKTTKEDTPWNSWFEEMAQKSAIRRLSKRLPMSTDLERVIQANDDLYDLSPKKEAIEAPKTKSSRLAKIVEAQVAEPVEAEVVAEKPAPPPKEEAPKEEAI